MKIEVIVRENKIINAIVKFNYINEWNGLVLKPLILKRTYDDFNLSSFLCEFNKLEKEFISEENTLKSYADESFGYIWADDKLFEYNSRDKEWYIKTLPTFQDILLLNFSSGTLEEDAPKTFG